MEELLPRCTNLWWRSRRHPAGGTGRSHGRCFKPLSSAAYILPSVLFGPSKFSYVLPQTICVGRASCLWQCEYR